MVLKTESDEIHQKCIILSCSHEAFSNGALGRVINLTSWPYIEFQFHKNHLEKGAWDSDRHGLRRGGLFFVLCSLLFLLLPGVCCINWIMVSKSCGSFFSSEYPDYATFCCLIFRPNTFVCDARVQQTLSQCGFCQGGGASQHLVLRRWI